MSLKNFFFKKKELERLESIKDWKLKMHSLEEIESLICQLWYSPNEENSLVNAQLLIELETKLNDILQVQFFRKFSYVIIDNNFNVELGRDVNVKMFGLSWFYVIPW